jgi:hypothetical protein
MNYIKNCDAFITLHSIILKRFAMQEEVCVFLFVCDIFVMVKCFVRYS